MLYVFFPDEDPPPDATAVELLELLPQPAIAMATIDMQAIAAVRRPREARDMIFLLVVELSCTMIARLSPDCLLAPR